MEEVLKQILSRLDNIDERLDNLAAGQARLEKKQDATFEQVVKNTEAIADINAKLSGKVKLTFLKAE